MRMTAAIFLFAVVVVFTPVNGKESQVSQYPPKDQRTSHHLVINIGSSLAKITVPEDLDDSSLSQKWFPQQFFDTRQKASILIMAYDCFNHLVYYSVEGVGVFRVALDGERGEQFISNTGAIRGLAVDWVHRKLYWTESKTKKIMVKELKSPLSSASQELLTVDKSPRGIAVMLAQKLLVWCSKSTMEISDLEGKNHKTVYSEDKAEMFNLVTFIGSKMVSWGETNANKGTVSSVVFDDISEGTWTSFMERFSAENVKVYGLTELDQVIYWRTIDKNSPNTAIVWYKNHLTGTSTAKKIHNTTTGGMNNQGLIATPSVCPLMVMLKFKGGDI